MTEHLHGCESCDSEWRAVRALWEVSTLPAPVPRRDLIQYAMSTDDVLPVCDWFMSREVPNAANHWVGTNVTGFKDPEYDAACHAAALALPGEAAYTEAYQQAQSVFANELPAIPLYQRLKVAAARADVCHFDLDPSAHPMWNIEAFDMGQGCQQ